MKNKMKSGKTAALAIFAAATLMMMLLTAQVAVTQDAPAAAACQEGTATYEQGEEGYNQLMADTGNKNVNLIVRGESGRICYDNTNNRVQGGFGSINLEKFIPGDKYKIEIEGTKVTITLKDKLTLKDKPLVVITGTGMNIDNNNGLNINLPSGSACEITVPEGQSVTVSQGGRKRIVTSLKGNGVVAFDANGNIRIPKTINDKNLVNINFADNDIIVTSKDFVYKHDQRYYAIRDTGGVLYDTNEGRYFKVTTDPLMVYPKGGADWTDWRYTNSGFAVVSYDHTHDDSIKVKGPAIVGRWDVSNGAIRDLGVVWQGFETSSIVDNKNNIPEGSNPKFPYFYEDADMMIGKGLFVMNVYSDDDNKLYSFNTNTESVKSKFHSNEVGVTVQKTHDNERWGRWVTFQLPPEWFDNPAHIGDGDIKIGVTIYGQEWRYGQNGPESSYIPLSTDLIVRNRGGKLETYFNSRIDGIGRFSGLYMPETFVMSNPAGPTGKGAGSDSFIMLVDNGDGTASLWFGTGCDVSNSITECAGQSHSPTYYGPSGWQTVMVEYICYKATDVDAVYKNLNALIAKAKKDGNAELVAIYEEILRSTQKCVEQKEDKEGFSRAIDTPGGIRY